MGPNSCWWGMGHFFGMPGGMIFGTIFWLLVILAVVFLIFKYVRKSEGDETKIETPLDILKKRYAKGEIDAEEFARKKKDLEL